MAEFPKDYTISDHALLRLKERDIPLETVTLALQANGFMSDGNDGRQIFTTKIEKDGKTYMLRVVYDPQVKPVKIVTIYVTSKIKKYGGTL